MLRYHIWITIQLPIDQNKFSRNFRRALAIKKYELTPAAASNELILFGAGTVSAIVGCLITGTNIQTSDLIADLNSILDELGIAYHSLIVSEFSHNSIWEVGNIQSDKFLLFDKLTSKDIN